MPESSERKRSPYSVTLVEGPFVELAPNETACKDVDALSVYAKRLKVQEPGWQPIFSSGAGGLSLGLEEAGFDVILSADIDPFSVGLHRHHFGGLAVDWDLSDPGGNVGSPRRSYVRREIELLAGGPPCRAFSKAGRYVIRHRVQNGLRTLVMSVGSVAVTFSRLCSWPFPPAVVMENVPDMALDRDMFILRSIVEELELLGYTVEERVVETWRYGVHQFRQRLILVGLRDGFQFVWPDDIGQDHGLERHQGPAGG